MGSFGFFVANNAVVFGLALLNVGSKKLVCERSEQVSETQ